MAGPNRTAASAPPPSKTGWRTNGPDRVVRAPSHQPRALGATRWRRTTGLPGFPCKLGRAFMSMNKERHLHAFQSYYRHLVAASAKHEQPRRPAPSTRSTWAVGRPLGRFLLETGPPRCSREHALPRGELRHRGGRGSIRPAIPPQRRCFTVEGERDRTSAGRPARRSPRRTSPKQPCAPTAAPHLRAAQFVGHYGGGSSAASRWQ